MKMKQKLIAGAVALSAFAGFSVPAVHAEVAASVGVSNMYYWRGYDLGGGAALTADINVSGNGFFAGAWTSSGDESLGTEYDLYAGYAGEAGDFKYGVSVVSYNYPELGGEEKIAPGDYVEIIPMIGYGPLKVTYYDAVAAEVSPLDNKDYSYATAELIFEKFAVKYGQHMDDGDTTSSHLDLTYKYNDKLSFTVGTLVDDGDDEEADDATFVVSLSLPIE
ncbi:TorF family putative porin [Cellvibrio sp. UBA7661]|uniref:TorF family putative porin n=1 Tax=Cellvibrio sp. UBA7661 TaxID=1946311 RepID=UPI002F35B5FC